MSQRRVHGLPPSLPAKMSRSYDQADLSPDHYEFPNAQVPLSAEEAGKRMGEMAGALPFAPMRPCLHVVSNDFPRYYGLTTTPAETPRTCPQLPPGIGLVSLRQDGLLELQTRFSSFILTIHGHRLASFANSKEGLFGLEEGNPTVYLLTAPIANRPPGAQNVLPMALPPSLLANDFNPTSFAYLKPIMLFCDQSSGKLAKTLGRATKFIGGGSASLSNDIMHVDSLVGDDGLDVDSKFVQPQCIVPAKEPNTFYVLEPRRIRVVNRIVSTLSYVLHPNHKEKLANWPMSLCSIAVSPNNVIFVADNLHRTVVAIADSVASIVYDFSNSDDVAGDYPTAITLIDSQQLAIRTTSTFRIVDVAALSAPHALSIKSTEHLPADVWMLIADNLDSVDAIRLQLLCKETRLVLRQRTSFHVRTHMQLLKPEQVFGPWSNNLPYLDTFEVKAAHPKAKMVYEAHHELLRYPPALQSLTLKIDVDCAKYIGAFRAMEWLHTLELNRMENVAEGTLRLLPPNLTRLALPQVTRSISLSNFPSTLTELDLRRMRLKSADLPPSLDDGEPLLPNLMTLILCDNLLQDYDVDHLPQSLTSLDIRNMENLTAAGVARLPRALLTLNVDSAPKLSNDAAGVFPPLLTSLHLSHNTFLTDEFFATLSTETHHQENLKELYAGDSDMTIYSLPYLELLLNLEILEAPRQFAKDLTMETVSRLPRLLSVLDLGANRQLKIVSDDPSLCSDWLPDRLHTLTWGASDVLKDEEFNALPASLTHLDLSQCETILPAGLARLKSRTPKLTYLDISFASKILPEHLASLPTTITSMVLPYSVMDALHPGNFEILSRFQALRELSLTHTGGATTLSSHVFFMLPHTITDLSLPNMKSVLGSHLSYLPSNLLRLNLDGVETLIDADIALLPRCLEILEIGAAKTVTPVGVSKHERLIQLRLGTDFQTLLQATRIAHIDRDAMLGKLPPRIRELDLPNLPDLKPVNFPLLHELHHLISGKDSHIVVKRVPTADPGTAATLSTATDANQMDVEAAAPSSTC